MTLAPQTYIDMVRLLQQHPKWRPGLCHLVAPGAERILASMWRESQRRSDATLAQAGASLVRWAEAQRSIEDRLARVETALQRPAKTVERTVDQVSRDTDSRPLDRLRNLWAPFVC